LVVHHVTPDAERQWIKAAESMYGTLRGGLVAADVFDTVQVYLKEYRAAH
jgi:hypothetical protein